MYNTLDLNVLNTYPLPYDINIDINAGIQIQFNYDISTDSVNGNFTVLEDKNMQYVDSTSLKNPNLFNVVDGTCTYKDRILYFTPKDALNKNTRYIVSIRGLENGIKSITDTYMQSDYALIFITSLDEILPPCTIVSPIFGSISDNTPTISWQDINADSYIVEISKQPTFETLYLNTITSDISITPSIELDDGLYYLRVKASTGVWSDALQFFVNTIKQVPATSEDYVDNDIFDLINTTNEIEILDQYPHDNDIDIDQRLKCIYIKLKGNISLDDIDMNNTFIEGTLYDSDDSDLNSNMGYLDGRWNVIYDTNEDASYIIFTPNIVVQS